MIKNFEEYINEDYFSKLANRKDTGTVRKENETTEEFVRKFIENGCEDDVESINIRFENGKKIVDVDGSFYLNVDTEIIPFQFGKVTGNFNASHCVKLTSLKGCPQEVGCGFYCYGCKNITSLEGCPQEVGSVFNCMECGKKFTKQDVQSLCNVKGYIRV